MQKFDESFKDIFSSGNSVTVQQVEDIIFAIAVAKFTVLDKANIMHVTSILPKHGAVSFNNEIAELHLDAVKEQNEPELVKEFEQACQTLNLTQIAK